ncbi:MAG: hypothetical protein EBR82_00560 [Caulobacteraceae bacterium]|nr:hypothetical protein [Caulobacteraceae bacterium]
MRNRELILREIALHDLDPNVKHVIHKNKLTPEKKSEAPQTAPDLEVKEERTVSVSSVYDSAPIQEGVSENETSVDSEKKKKPNLKKKPAITPA